MYHATYVLITFVSCKIFSTYGISRSLVQCRKCRTECHCLFCNNNKEKPATLQPDGLSIQPPGAAQVVAVISLLLLQNQLYHSVWHLRESLRMYVKTLYWADPLHAVTRGKNMCFNFSCAPYTENTLGYDTGNRNG